jgi:hypothetical protein
MLAPFRGFWDTQSEVDRVLTARGDQEVADERTFRK